MDTGQWREREREKRVRNTGHSDNPGEKKRRRGGENRVSVRALPSTRGTTDAVTAVGAVTQLLCDSLNY